MNHQRFRQLSEKGSLFFRLLAIGISIYHLIYLSGIIDIWWYFPAPVFRSISLSMLMLLFFFIVPHTRKRTIDHIPWFDYFFMVLSVVPPAYYGLNYQNIILQFGNANLLQQVLGACLIVAILEAVRRIANSTLSIIAAFFVIYPLTASYFPGFLYTRSYSISRTLGQIYLYPEGMLGILLDITASLIIGFIIFGAFLNASGAGKTFTDLALSLTGKTKSGPALTAVISSALFGSINGSAVANTASTGVITIPLMKKSGLSPEFSAAIEAVASTGGQLMPPVMGAAAFVMADLLEMPYYQLVIAAIIPSLLCYLVLCLNVVFEVELLPIRIMGKDKIPNIRQTLAKGWFHFIPLIVLVYFLIVVRLTPKTAVFYTIVAVVVIMIAQSIFQKDCPPATIFSKFAEALKDGALGTLDLIAPVIAAGIIMGSLSLTALGLNISSQLALLSGNNLFVLAIVAALASLVLGMGLPTIAAYIMVVLIIAPALVNQGVLPLAAHMFLFYFALASMITPPVALTAYVGAAIAGANPLKTCWKAAKIGIALYLVPFSLLKHPGLFLIEGSSFVSTCLQIIITLAGAFIVVCGTSGCLRKSLIFSPVQRILLTLAGGALMVSPERSMILIGFPIVTTAVIFIYVMSKNSKNLSY